MIGRLTLLVALLVAAAAHAEPPAALAARIVAEGLAMRAAPPGGADFTEPARRRAEILQNVQSALAGGETLGNQDVRYAGWQIVGFWLAHGESFAEIEAVKDGDARVAEAIDLMLKEPR